MKLLEALELIRQPAAADGSVLRVYLACGFTPLHLQTYLEAWLRRLRQAAPVAVDSGVYGDLAGNLERMNPDSIHACIVVTEWSDLDPRLGYRSLGGWRPRQLESIGDTVHSSLARLTAALGRLAGRIPIVVAGPTLPVAPVAYEPPQQAGVFVAQLQAACWRWVAELAALPGVRVLNSAWLDLQSPASARLDLKSEIQNGFPYQLGHADTLGETLAQLVVRRAPLKGIITDLDDTLWAGILGEVGVDAVAWTLEHGALVHGLYQQMLQALADTGVLLGVASKNDAALVSQALSRKDLIIKPDSVFPVEAHWGPKSSSVRRILEDWNIAPDAVVFIDDSPMEIAEVQAEFPSMEGIVFPKSNPAALGILLGQLRSRFGKEIISQEDFVRLASLRSAAEVRAAAGEDISEEFLRSAEAVVSFDEAIPPPDGRPLELVNKTNQFNLNGRRYNDAEWTAALAEPGAFLLVASYEDRFGPLGRIAVLAGVRRQRELHIHTWVMSCRAFSRRIEHACLQHLLESTGAESVVLDFVPTPRNGPLQRFLSTHMGAAAAPMGVISRDQFYRACPPTYHRRQLKQQ